jgi:Xaa-Pro aminopeptidase
MTAWRLDALVVTSLPNITYLTNFTGSTAIVLVTSERLYFITDFRYVTAMTEAAATAAACPDLELAIVDGTYDGTLCGLLANISGRIGFEAQHVSVTRYHGLVKAIEQVAAERAELIPTDGIVERLRERKDDYEIATLREAARRLSDVARAVFGDVRPGITEAELALTIDMRVRQGGFFRAAFDTIVASGINGARPHATPGERKLTEGDLVVLDFGGVYDSYCVDLTRTVSIGAASVRAREVYGAVLEAHDQAIAAARPGASRFDIDAAARSALARHGLADAFGHGTGHGLGLEVHEAPRLTRRHVDADADGEEVAAGMVFTIEPGAYLPGWGGVRIEDDVLMTDAGADVLTDVPTALLEL